MRSGHKEDHTKLPSSIVSRIRPILLSSSPPPLSTDHTVVSSPLSTSDLTHTSHSVETGLGRCVMDEPQAVPNKSFCFLEGGMVDHQRFLRTVQDDEDDDVAREDEQQQDILHPEAKSISSTTSVGFSEDQDVNVEKLSRQELIDTIEQLYHNLKCTEYELLQERSRRRAREKSLIRLTNELQSKETELSRTWEHLEDLQDELRMARTERSLMEQRLDLVLEHDMARADERMNTLKSELVEAHHRYDTTCQDYERKLQGLLRCDHHRVAPQIRQYCYQKYPTTRYPFMTHFSFTIALPFSFLFLSDWSSRSTYVSYALWSVTFLLLIQLSIASSTFDPYELNGGLVSAVAGKNFAILATDTRMFGNGLYQLKSRSQLASRMWSMDDHDDASMLSKVVQDTLRSASSSANARTVPKFARYSSSAVVTVSRAPIMVGCSGCSSDCHQLQRIIRADIRAAQYFGQLSTVIHPAQAANVVSQTLYSRRSFPYYAFCVVCGLEDVSSSFDSNDGCGGNAYVYDAIGSYEQVAVAAAGTGRELLQPILDRLFVSTSQQPKQVDGTVDQAIDNLCRAYRSVSEREIGVGDNLVLFVSERKADVEQVCCRILVFPLKEH